MRNALRRWCRSVANSVVALLWLLQFLPGQAGAAHAEEGSGLYAEALHLKEVYRDAEALALFEKLLKNDPENPKTLLHVAHLHFRIGWLYSEKEERRHRFFAAHQVAQKALALAPDDVAVRLMTVVAKGKIAGFLSSAEQVRLARELREEVVALAAIIGPDDVDLLHVQAWLNYKVGKTSSVERLLARLLFGGLPEDLSVDTAFSLMRRAMELRPQSLVYPYDLGIFYQRLGDETQARPWFEKVVAMVPATPEDQVYQNWARQRLKRINHAGG